MEDIKLTNCMHLGLKHYAVHAVQINYIKRVDFKKISW
jgi:hypothetical protein